MKSHPYKEKYLIPDQLLKEEVDTSSPIDSVLLKEYIRYAKDKCRP